MQNRFGLLILVLNILLMSAGCMSNSSVNSKVPLPLMWTEEGIKHEGVTIALGYRSSQESDRSIEPIAAITRDGAPVANAMVFCSLVSADGGEVIGEESATVYEPASGKTPALYGQAKLNPSQKNALYVVRFRVLLPDIDQAWTREVKIPPR